MEHVRGHLWQRYSITVKFFKIVIPLVSGWLLFSANSSIGQLCHGKNKLIFNEMKMRSALFSNNTLSWIFIVLGHWSTRSHYSDSEPTSVCSFSLMLRGERRSINYQFQNLWFDPTGARTFDLPHSMALITIIYIVIIFILIIVSLGTHHLCNWILYYVY